MARPVPSNKSANSISGPPAIPVKAREWPDDALVEWDAAEWELPSADGALSCVLGACGSNTPHFSGHFGA
jgi:hypothetical protein